MQRQCRNRLTSRENVFSRNQVILIGKDRGRIAWSKLFRISNVTVLCVFSAFLIVIYFLIRFSRDGFKGFERHLLMWLLCCLFLYVPVKRDQSEQYSLTVLEDKERVFVCAAPQ